MVARGYSDQQIAGFLGVRVTTVQNRVAAVYHLMNMALGEEAPAGNGMTRVRLVAWAYENGLVGSSAWASKAQAATKRERELAEAAFDVLRQLVHKRPYPVVRDQAVAIIREVDAEATIEAYEAARAA
jgi:hypothetical protein